MSYKTLLKLVITIVSLLVDFYSLTESENRQMLFTENLWNLQKLLGTE